MVALKVVNIYQINVFCVVIKVGRVDLILLCIFLLSFNLIA